MEKLEKGEIDRRRKKKEQESAEAISGLKKIIRLFSSNFSVANSYILPKLKRTLIAFLHTSMPK